MQLSVFIRYGIENFWNFKNILNFKFLTNYCRLGVNTKILSIHRQTLFHCTLLLNWLLTVGCSGEDLSVDGNVLLKIGNCAFDRVRDKRAFVWLSTLLTGHSLHLYLYPYRSSSFKHLHENGDL